MTYRTSGWFVRDLERSLRFPIERMSFFFVKFSWQHGEGASTDKEFQDPLIAPFFFYFVSD